MIPRPVLVLLAVISLGACTSDGGAGSEVTPGTDLAVLPIGEPTVPSPEDLPAALVARLTREIPDVIGVILTLDQAGCIARGLTDEIDTDAYLAMKIDGVLVEQPQIIQDQVFGVFDRCVPPAAYGSTAAPILVLAGVEPRAAACTFEAMATTMGFAGMYSYALGAVGEIDPDPGLADRVKAAFASCAVDPTVLTVPLGPTTTLDPTAPTSAPLPSTTPPANASTSTSTTVEPPVSPPTQIVTATSVPQRSTTTRP